MSDPAENVDGLPAASDLSACVMRCYGIPTEPSTGAGATVADVFDPQARALHCHRLDDAAARRRSGVTWAIDPAFGQGSYWYHAIDAGCAICSFSMAFVVEETVSCSTPPFLCLGAYGRGMTPYFGLDDEHARRTVLGYAWDSPRYVQLLRPEGDLCATSIVLLPDGTERMAPALGCTAEELRHAVCALDGSAPVPRLSALLAEADTARPSARTAQAYYTAKIVEALAIALDLAQRPTGTEPRARALSEADRAALARVRQAIDEHLDTVLPNEVLCRLAFIGESKLARLFKQAEGVTPQEYARRRRMERARELLEMTDAPLSEVARACGYKRQGSFSEAFRNHYGCTPRAFRGDRHHSAVQACQKSSTHQTCQKGPVPS